QDILSHVRIAFCDRIDTLRDRNQVKNFLFQITRDEIRRHWLRYSRTADLEETVRSDTNSPQTELLAAERLNALRDCLKRIEDPVTRDVGQLRFRQYLRLEDISNQIHLSLDQVKRRVAKVKKLVTDCMRAKFGDQLP
ncbi:MAG: sigma-70 family RNA polymerase sigma factor, partial [Chromatiales bacterium]|nr:sigma-70 family RNA polymerase sigma factor [Chromatiales bacterium]